ncbi:MAG: fatty acid desaturase [Steroidobacteraceae bacterium]|jgi:omega-6 fatty acid desaturase (delta-12 desaturase)
MLGRQALPERDPPEAPSTLPGQNLSIAALRGAMEPFCRKRDAYALGLLTFDLALFGAGQCLAVAAANPWLVALGVLLTWSAIVRLFVIGHDACHQALTSSKPLNDAIGRIAFLVSLTPYSLWRTGHNIVHHGFNNLRGRDFIWEPKQTEEYLALPRWRRAVERIYRGALGPGLYYFVEIWWKRLFFPNRRQMPAARAEFTRDSMLAAAAAIIWIGAILWYAETHARSFWVTLSIACIIPFVLWNWTVGLVVYLHHTHPDVQWYAERREWLQGAAQISATAHLLVPAAIGAWMHHIMEHPAHHLNSTIPLYNLKAAQRHLYEIGAAIKREPFTIAHYFDCVRTCKLYDYATKSWIPFPAA